MGAQRSDDEGKTAHARESWQRGATSPPPPGDGFAFIEALRAREREALGALFDRHAEHVERILTRVLGWDHEIPDLAQEVFVQAIASIDRFRGDADKLGPWLTSIAVHLARNRIRQRTTRRWLRPWAAVAPGAGPSPAVAGPEVVDTVRRTLAVIEKLPVDERIPFALRFIDRMELTEVAEACGVSLATVKRRLGKARSRFDRHARKDPVLRAWVEGGPDEG